MSLRERFREWFRAEVNLAIDHVMRNLVGMRTDLDTADAYLENLDRDMKEAIPEILQLIADVATTLEQTTRLSGDTDQRLRFYEKHSAMIGQLKERLDKIRKEAAEARAQMQQNADAILDNLEKTNNVEVIRAADGHPGRRPLEAEVPSGSRPDAERTLGRDEV